MVFDKASLPKALLFGTVSAILYTLMFIYSGELVEYAHRTRQGEHIWFFIPIVIAFVFFPTCTAPSPARSGIRWG